jgi:hypothetical protein
MGGAWRRARRPASSLIAVYWKYDRIYGYDYIRVLLELYTKAECFLG